MTDASTPTEQVPPCRRSWRLVLAIQALNAFNDNFVKMLLVTFAGAVATENDLGRSMQVYLGAIFALPYILFAPLAGWLSDRFCKQRVILAMQLLQVLIFVGFIAALGLHEANLTLALSLGIFFALATQAAIFGPAKLGVLRDLLPASELQRANSLMQMTMFIGILGGIGAGGSVFGLRLKSLGDPWQAAMLPLQIITALACLQILGAWLVRRGRGNPDLRFRISTAFEHFHHLRLTFAQPQLRAPIIGISLFWLFCSAIGSMAVIMSQERHPQDAAARALDQSLLCSLPGLGFILGAALCAIAARRQAERSVVPLSALGLVGGLLWIGLGPLQGNMAFVSMAFAGTCASAFMTPLYGIVQQQAKGDQLARVLSSMNLLDCAASIVANLLWVKGLQSQGVGAQQQILSLLPLAFIMLWAGLHLLTQPPLANLILGWLRLFYHLRARHTGQLPKRGGVLMLSNHLSYVDALLMAASSPRLLRFVMWDAIYHKPWLRWLFKLAGTVPISPTRAKEAVRSVAEALQNEQVVALFPEGQISRHGLLNGIRPGYALMARKAKAPVLPIWLDGLYGSIFSHAGNACMRRLPRRLRYPVTVHYGQAIEADQASPQALIEAWLDLAAQANAERGTSSAQRNAQALLHVEWLGPKDQVLCLAPSSSLIFQTLQEWSQLCGCRILSQADAVPEQALVLVGNHSQLAACSLQAKLRYCWEDEFSSMPANALPVLIGAESGLLQTLSLPHPQDQPRSGESQIGHRPGSPGRPMLGTLNAAGLRALMQRHDWQLDDQGLLVPRSAVQAATSPTA